jgi:predicted O-linked N-acetylglucosamine transferase (SPINDLY family)
MLLWVVVLCAMLALALGNVEIDRILSTACEKGDLPSAYRMVNKLMLSLDADGGEKDSQVVASTLHIKSCLELVTQGNYSAAVNYHQRAKAADKTVVPPLAALHLAEKTCGGISDIFFVSAVIIKELANEDKEATKPRIIDMTESDPNASPALAKAVYEGFQTLVTLTFDSGLHRESEALVNRAISMLSAGATDSGIGDGDASIMSSEDKQRLLAFRIRGSLLSPAVFESHAHLHRTRRILADRAFSLAEDIYFTNSNSNSTEEGQQQKQKTMKTHLRRLDEFVVSPTFYFVYQGYRDRYFLQALHEVYSAAFPDLNDVHVPKDFKSPYNAKKESSSKNKKKKKDKKDKIEKVEEAMKEGKEKKVEEPMEGLRQEEQDALLAKRAATAQRRDEEERDPALREPIRVGFLSAHLRKHSICKLFCGVIGGLSNPASVPTPRGARPLEVYAFSSLQENHEDDHTKALIASLAHKDRFVRVGKTVVSNRNEVTRRGIDVLVFLDVGMDPSTMIWASARLAPLQLCLWGHPTTTGSSHMDYFVSSFDYHEHAERRFSEYGDTLYIADREIDPNAATLDHRNLVSAPGALGREHALEAEPAPMPAHDSFSEQLLMFDSLGFHFEKPDVDSGTEVENAGLLELLQHKKEHGTKLILFPQHLPKLHPGLDAVFRELLIQVPNSELVLVFGASKKMQWKRTIERRWDRPESISKALMQEKDEHGRGRIIWLDNLKSHEYSALLAAGDLMLDPFPFGGGVTTLESLAVCTPVMTLPSAQTVPALAAGMIRQIAHNAGDSSIAIDLIADSVESYIERAVALLGGNTPTAVSDRLLAIRQAVCAHNWVLFESQSAAREWGALIWGMF